MMPIGGKSGFEGGNLLLHSGPADDCGLQNKGRANNESGKCKVWQMVKK